MATKVTESIKALGKLDAGAFKAELAAALSTLSGETMRWMVGKEVKTTTKGDVYGRKWEPASYAGIVDTVLEREYQKNLILQAVKAGCASPRAIRDKIGPNKKALGLARISYLLADMEKTRMVEFRGMENQVPVFAAV